MSKELTPLEKLQLLVPGYRGYKVKDLIRQDDMLIRNYVRQHLENSLSKLSEKESLIAQNNPFSPNIKQIELLNSKIRSLVADMATMQGGGADVYARYKITSEALETIVQNDVRLVSLANLLYDNANLGDINSINSILDEMRLVLAQRQNLFFPSFQ
ncbi:hypothetical protein [Sulfuracidifex tepidarius]|uniref:Uncharacterized protein n=1 Tax=Sulfuracidifex tepidarius TaxID=1294262 RepID=A0A510DZU8_9CREN|nr:hypothetical protein [Sulfuracidifex tepidarius]BBG23003.1 hypothetical protein IC006_0287 [Sulfuracidifex tepidarius]BBG25765.1 hypothetical protein IC007_0270 [Sulfuracidifex tepidarius]